ncbi:thiazolylpeptide-type bacteriocin [Embleya sp. AB8]|uniref:thiazolylpeptide-type bacteriocin n=1 Tax=Embleya sp. AB8 TaxID=3156304 RepID=UPI003C707BAD
MEKNLDLTTLAKELQTLETETFEIQDYTETSDLLTAHKAESMCSTSSCSTCSSTTSTTSCCA